MKVVGAILLLAMAGSEVCGQGVGELLNNWHFFLAPNLYCEHECLQSAFQGCSPKTALNRWFTEQYFDIGCERAETFARCIAERCYYTSEYRNIAQERAAAIVVKNIRGICGQYKEKVKSELPCMQAIDNEDLSKCYEECGEMTLSWPNMCRVMECSLNCAKGEIAQRCSGDMEKLLDVWAKWNGAAIHHLYNPYFNKHIPPECHKLIGGQ